MLTMSARLRPSRFATHRAGHPEIAEQDCERPGQLDRGQVLAHDVLDQRELERAGLVEGTVDERGDRFLSRQFGGAPAALAGNELVFVAGGADDHRL